MTALIRFSSDLSRWLTEHLIQNTSPAHLADTMIAEGMEVAVARAIVAAFVDAYQKGEPLPVDAISIAPDALDYIYEPSRIASASRIIVNDRVIPVLARVAQPVLAVLGNLLSDAECDALISLAKPRLKPSTVVDPATGKNIIAPYRTSLGMFFRLGETPLIAQLDQRMAEVMNLPVENGEGIQVLYYPQGAGNSPHFDFLLAGNPTNQASIARSGQRVSTLITYLNHVDAGGETLFPRINLQVSPWRGNAVYFEYCNSFGQLDERSLHSGNTVLAGEKWVATKWMRQRKFISANDASS